MTEIIQKKLNDSAAARWTTASTTTRVWEPSMPPA